MIQRTPRYPKEEIARRGKELYENKIRPMVATGHHGQMLAIDIESGDYEVANEALDACQTLIEHHPDAQIWCLRIGHVAAERLGFHGATEET